MREKGARSGVIGVKGGAGGAASRRSKSGAQHRPAVGTAGLEWARSARNAWCSGEMHRYHAELRLRRQRTGALLTLRHESVGIEQD